MIKLRPKKEEELNYWQSISDVMAALLLIVLLIMMLFILYMTRVPDLELTEDILGADNEIGDGVDDDWGNVYGSIYWGRYWDHSGEGGVGGEAGAGHGDGNGEDGDGGYGDGRGDGTGDYVYEHPGEGDWEGQNKAAVYVKVIDGETRASIKEPGISFRLYKERAGLQRLYTYYPVREMFESFATTASGTFYLPEKIGLGSYWFNETSVPYGYDKANNINFAIEESHDWKNAFVVTVELYPCKNIVRVQNTDAKTGEKISGGAYDIIAATDIVTADGTLRYTEGEVADRIECGEDGYGESKELYLGHYLIRPVTAPDFYALCRDDTDVFLERRDSEAHPVTYTVKHEKTVLKLTVADELYTDSLIKGAVFDLMLVDGTLIEKDLTGRNGIIRIESLEKNTGYVLRQTETAEGYTVLDKPVAFSVSADGRIDGKAEADRTVSNRKIRVAIVVKDSIIGNEVSDKSLALFDAKGNLLELWTSTALPMEFEGLEPGTYSVVYNGKNESALGITVQDTKEIQEFTYTIWMPESIVMMFACGIVFIGAFAAVIIIRGRKKKNEVSDEAK